MIQSGGNTSLSPRDVLKPNEIGARDLEGARRKQWHLKFARCGRLPLSEVVWLGPMRRPSTICCIAFNSNNKDRIMCGLQSPVMFIKPSYGLVGHMVASKGRAAYGVRPYITLPDDIVSLATALQKAAKGSPIQNVESNRPGGSISVAIERMGTLINSVCWV